MHRFLRPVALGLAALATAGITIVAAAAPFTFTGSPPVPEPAVLAGWDVQVHDQSTARGDDVFPVTTAEHGADCAGPPATHTVTDRAGAVFQCRDHVMTSMAGDYGVIYLTPGVLVDLSQERVITWSMSTHKASARDWPDFTLSAYADSQALPLWSTLSQDVDLQRPNRNSVVVTTDNAEGAPNLAVIRNDVVETFPQNFPALDAGIPSTVNQSAVREPVKLTVSQTRVRFERLPSASDPDGQVFFDHTIAPLGFTEAVFSLGHHSYNPTKDCTAALCIGTWHWDDLTVPGTDFYIERLSPRFVSGPTSLNFAPAPAGAELRFSAVCRPVVNGVPLTKMTDNGHPENTASYRVALPAGSTAVGLSFAADGWYTPDLGCHAKDFAVWARNGVVPTATATPAPTPTVAPTPVPTPTPTATPATYRCQIRNANGSYTTLPGWPKVGGGACP